MELTGQNIYQGYIQGAKLVIRNKHHLNEINVFPVRDGDTGSNLSSMMGAILKDARSAETPKATVESVSDAALRGARGNSGIIFAQYLSGMSIELIDGIEITLEHFAQASERAVKYAYEAIDNPVEGTMITMMKVWGQSLMALVQINSEPIVTMDIAYGELEASLKETQFQLKDLKKAGVVDSGAKGFVYFIKGMLEFFRNGEVDHDDVDEELEELLAAPLHDEEADIHHRYCTEGFIEGEGMDVDAIRKALRGLGDSMVVAGNERKCRVHIHSDVPAKVFEALYKHGKITFQKADDMVKQQNIITHRRSKIALLTDTIADLPMSMVDEEQIHLIHLHLLFQEMSFIDKLTITPAKILAYSKDAHRLPTSSQPDPKQIENILGYLKTYYDSVIVMTVSSQLSGTYSNVSKVAKAMSDENFTISVIDTKQNSGAQGLLVAKASALVNQGLSHEAIVENIKEQIPKSKILVRVKTLDSMIKSGRLSSRAGKIGKFIGLKPIVTLDAKGEGALDGVAFSTKGSLKKLVGHMQRIHKTQKITSYSIVHINNPEEAEEFAEVFTKLLGRAPDYITETSSIVAVGAGDGAVALSYLIE